MGPRGLLWKLDGLSEYDARRPLTAELGPYDPSVQQLRQDEALCMRSLGQR